jgi:hypothetical protein
VARIGKAQRVLDRALDHRDRIEELIAKPWFRRHARPSALNFIESQLRKDCFYLFTKDQRRVIDEIVAEMRPYSGFAGTTIDELIDMAVLCKADCAYYETETWIDALNEERPVELPLCAIKHLVSICRLRFSLPDFSDEFADAPDRGDEEDKQERAEAAADRWTRVPVRPAN